MGDRNDNRGDDKQQQCAQVAVESIITWGEASGVSDLPQDLARVIAADVTYRLRQTLSVCGEFLRHNKRRRLTPDDINRALTWMDVPSINGYTSSDPVEWQAVPEVGVHISHDPMVNLASTGTGLSGDIFHQPGSPCVRGEWAYITGHTMVKAEGGGGGGGGGDSIPAALPLGADHLQYYKTLFTTITGPSNDLFKLMCDDVRSNPGVNGMIGYIVGGIMRGAQRARQKPCILRRLLLIIQAILLNPNIHLGPQNYMRDIINVLVYCIIVERKSPQDTQMIRSLACNVLLQVVSREPGCRITWDGVVSSLGGVVASSSRPWGQHVGALLALLTLGCPALLHSLTPIARSYHNRLAHAIAQSPSPSTRDALDAHTAKCLLLAGLVNVMKSYVKSLPDNLVMFSKESTSPSPPPSTSIASSGMCEGEVPFEQVQEIYNLGEEAFGSAFITQVPSVYLCCTPEHVPSFLQSSVYRDQAISGDALLNPPPPKRKHKGSSSQYHHHHSPKVRHGLQPYVPAQVFEGYRSIPDRLIQVNIGGCPTWSADRLKRRGSSLPTVVPHPHRPLLARYCARLTGCMPHNTFTKPLVPPLRPGPSLQYLIL